MSYLCVTGLMRHGVEPLPYLDHVYVKITEYAVD